MGRKGAETFASTAFYTAFYLSEMAYYLAVAVHYPIVVWLRPVFAVVGHISYKSVRIFCYSVECFRKAYHLYSVALGVVNIQFLVQPAEDVHGLFFWVNEKISYLQILARTVSLSGNSADVLALV